MTTTTEKYEGLDYDLTPCQRCGCAPVHIWNESVSQALCEACNTFFDRHTCTGDNCYCIGGDENLDIIMQGC